MCLQERQKQLESLGISLQSSGIKVGDDKCFLVNLNADPALNELLVYYLKVRWFPPKMFIMDKPFSLWTDKIRSEKNWSQYCNAFELSHPPQDHTKVGSADSQDIQLCGMGIQAEHCVIDITTDVAVILTPHPNARYGVPALREGTDRRTPIIVHRYIALFNLLQDMR